MEKINFKNSKRINLVGVLHAPNTQITRVVVIAHGFTSNKDRERHIKLANALAENDIAAFRIDFGGCGESAYREITIGAQVDDLCSAIEYVKKRGYEHIGVLGESLGGITALEAYNKYIEAMVLWAPVTKLGLTIEILDEQKQFLQKKGYYIYLRHGREFKIPQAFVDELKNIDRKKILGNVRIPVLIIHGTADKTIPIKDSEEAVDLLPEGSSLEKIENWEHGDYKMNADMDIIIPITLKWFENHLSK